MSEPGAEPAVEPGSTYEQPGAANDDRSAATASPLDGLTPAPRRVPPAYAAAGLSFNIVEVWAVFMVVVAPIALWGLVPVTIPAALILGLGLLVTLRVRALLPRLAMLRWGDPTTDAGPGVALADSRDRTRVRPLSDFGYVLSPGPDGNLTGHLPTSTWVGIALTALLYTALAVATVLTTDHLWLN